MLSDKNIIATKESQKEIKVLKVLRSSVRDALAESKTKGTLCNTNRNAYSILSIAVSKIAKKYKVQNEMAKYKFKMKWPNT